MGVSEWPSLTLGQKGRSRLLESDCLLPAIELMTFSKDVICVDPFYQLLYPDPNTNRALSRNVVEPEKFDPPQSEFGCDRE